MFKPMLASDAVLENLRFPLLASPKLDGVRAIVRDGVVYSRSNKPIPNKHVQSLFTSYEHFDGELIMGDPTAHSVYRDTVSVVMSHDKVEPVRLYVFDYVAKPHAKYDVRRAQLKADMGKNVNKNVVLHEQTFIENLEQLLRYETQCLVEGFEGLILRDPNSAYKMGRSTANEGILLKVKRFLDAEATIIGYEERMENTNEKTTNELGRSTRSSHKVGKVGRGDLGALLVDFDGIKFAIGTGFDDVERAHIWTKRDEYIGKLVKFKYFPVGVKTAPRHPVFLGFRDGSDM
jgi:DNA ligase-1